MLYELNLTTGIAIIRVYENSHILIITSACFVPKYTDLALYFDRVQQIMDKATDIEF